MQLDAKMKKSRPKQELQIRITIIDASIVSSQDSSNQLLVHITFSLDLKVQCFSLSVSWGFEIWAVNGCIHIQTMRFDDSTHYSTEGIHIYNDSTHFLD